MKIAIVTRFPKIPDAPRGGVESVSVNLVRALTKIDGLKIYVVTTDPQTLTPCVHHWNGVVIHRLPFSAKTMIGHAIGPDSKTVREKIKDINPDVVHSHDVYGIMVSKLALPRVFTVHGFIYADTKFSNAPLSGIRSWIWKRIETSSWRNQPHIISISPYVRQHLEKFVSTTTKIYDIDNPIDDVFFDIRRSSEQMRIFSAAWLSARKNTLGLLKGFARVIKSIPQAKLILAGEAKTQKYFEEIKRFIEREGIADNVELLGRIDRSAIMNELSRTSIFVLASLEENSPMAIEEAMAGGVPVITSNRCGMPYMIEEGKSGFLIDPDNPQNIAERIIQLIKNDNLRQQMSQRGREIALERFHSRIVAEKTVEVYQAASR